MRKLTIAMAVIGIIIIFGAVGYDDSMMFSGTPVDLAYTVKMICLGFLLLVPEIGGMISGKK